MLPSQDKIISHRIFFGDNEKLKFILDRIDEKIRHIQFQKSKIQSKEAEDYSQKFLTRTLFSTSAQEKKKFSLNPIFGKNKLSHMHEADIIESRDLSMMENLKKLKELISLRINLNDMLTPYFIKEQNNKHRQLIL